MPVKIDVMGNINVFEEIRFTSRLFMSLKVFVLPKKKLTQKYSMDKQKFYSLQAIVQVEIDDEVTKVKNSATDALLWLKRSVEL